VGITGLTFGFGDDGVQPKVTVMGHISRRTSTSDGLWWDKPRSDIWIANFGMGTDPGKRATSTMTRCQRARLRSWRQNFGKAPLGGRAPSTAPAWSEFRSPEPWPFVRRRSARPARPPPGRRRAKLAEKVGRRRLQTPIGPGITLSHRRLGGRPPTISLAAFSCFRTLYSVLGRCCTEWRNSNAALIPPLQQLISFISGKRL